MDDTRDSTAQRGTERDGHGPSRGTAPPPLRQGAPASHRSSSTSSAVQPPLHREQHGSAGPPVRRVPCGTLLLGAGTRPDGVVVVRKGSAECVARPNGRRVVVRVLGPGDIEGDVQVLLGTPMPYSVRATTDAEVELWPDAAFHRMLGTGRGADLQWTRALAQRLADTQDRLAHALGGRLSARLAGLLLAQAVGRAVELPQSTIAALVGAGRPSVNQLLRRWHDAGVVSVDYGRVQLVDVAALERLRDAVGG